MIAVVGGHSRNIGKTSLACGVIAGTPELEWTAVKVTQFGHGICSADGKPCSCAVEDLDHPFAISEERDRDGGSDTSRMLRAGARRSLWLRVPQGRLGEAMPALRERLGGDVHVLYESNSVVDFVEPDVYLSLIDFAQADFKASAARLLGRADALVTVGEGEALQGWPALGDARRFVVWPPGYCSGEVAEFVRRAAASPERK